MGKVERAVVEALIHGINGGLPYVPEADLEVAARAAGGAGRAAEYAVARLLRRGLLSSQWEGTRRVGYRPTVKAYEELSMGEQAEPKVAPDCGRHHMISGFQVSPAAAAGEFVSIAGLGSSMPENCTILCPTDEPQQIVAYLRDLLQTGADIRVTGKDSDWSKIEIKRAAASLTLNRQIRREPGDAFSKMVLGMHNYFRCVKTTAEATQKDVLNRVANMALAIGVVAEPEFVEDARHYDCIFGIADALNAIVWTGRGVINADGKMILDEDGNSEVA